MPEITVKVNSVPIEMTIDTGASTNVLDDGAFTCLNQAQGIELSHSSTRLMAYGSKSRFEISGKFTAAITGPKH